MSNGSKLTHVRPGDPLEIGAGTFNAMIDAAKAHRASQHNVGRTTRPDLRQANMVIVKNDSGADVSRYGVLGITGPLFDPTSKPVPFHQEIVMVGDEPDDRYHIGKFVIAQEPIKAGELGHAMIAGVSIVQVLVPDAAAEAFDFVEMIDGESGHLAKSATGTAHVVSMESGYHATTLKWAVISFGNPLPVSISWVKAKFDWENYPGNGSFIFAHPCDDKDGTTVDTDTTLVVRLPRNGRSMDPNLRQDAIFPVILGPDDEYFCAGDYLDEEIGSHKLWYKTMIPAGWALADGTTDPGSLIVTKNFKGRFIVGYDASDTDYDAVGKTGGYAEHGDSENDHNGHDLDHFHGLNGITTLSREAGALSVTGVTPPYQTSSPNWTGDIPDAPGTSDWVGHSDSDNRPKFYTEVVIERVD